MTAQARKASYHGWRSIRSLVRLVGIAALLIGVWLAPTRDATAYVTLSYFKAETQPDGSILVSWETATELSTVAFQVFRAESESGPWDNMIHQEGAKGDSIVGASYSFNDAQVTLGTTYWYLLRELASDNSGGDHGPVSATASLAPTNTPTVTPSATATATNTPTATPTEKPTETATATATPSPSPTHTATLTAAPTATGAAQATATRQFANTPGPTNTPQPSATPTPVTATATSTGTPTPLPSAQVAAPTGGPGTRTRRAPTVSTALPRGAATATSRGPGAAATATPAESATPTGAAATPATATSTKTATPAVFLPKETGGPLLARTTAHPPTPSPAVTAPEQFIRNPRLMLVLGTGAIGLAVLMGIAGLLIWRSRNR